MISLFLYIDPGTGSMLFSILIGIVSTLLFLFQRFFLRLKFILNGGKKIKTSNKKEAFVIFSDNKRYWSNFKPVCDEFEKRKVPVVYWTSSSDDPALQEKYEFVKIEFIGEGNKAFARLNFLNANICISTTPGLNIYQWKRSKNCNFYVHMPHALDEMMGYRMLGIDFYDAILLTGEIQKYYIRKLEEMRNLPQKELVITGYPFMDQQKALLDSCQKKDKKDITVLIAPSWGSNSILSKYGKTFLSAISKTGYKTIIRPHPQSLISEKLMLDDLMKTFPDSDLLIWNFDNNNFNCMNEASILISDFSGIIFDFTFLFDKPVIYADTSFNSDVYDAAWFKNEKLWRFQALEKIGIQLNESQFPELKEIILNAVNNTSLQEERNNIRNQIWMNIGKSAKLTVDYLIEKNNFLLQHD